MAIQPMALQVQTPTVDGMAGFAQGASTGMQLEGMRREQAQQGISMIAKISLGAMGGQLDGEVNPQHFEQGLDLLEQQGVDVSNYRGRPEIAQVAARASLSALEQLNLARDDRSYQLALKKFEQDMASGTTETFGVTPIKGRDPEGKPQYFLPGSQGTLRELDLPEGWEAQSRYEKIDVETGTLVIDTVTGEERFVPKKIREAAFEKEVGGAEGKRAGTRPERMAKAKGALSGLKRQQRVVVENIDDAIEQITSNPGVMVGFVGDLVSNVKGTPQFDLAQTLLTIKANLGFDRLQEMRNNSPTGGALGQVSEKENELLQAINGALAQGQSDDQLLSNLMRIKELQAELMVERETAFNTDFGDGQTVGEGDNKDPLGLFN